MVGCRRYLKVALLLCALLGCWRWGAFTEPNWPPEALVDDSDQTGIIEVLRDMMRERGLVLNGMRNAFPLGGWSKNDVVVDLRRSDGSGEGCIVIVLRDGPGSAWRLGREQYPTFMGVIVGRGVNFADIAEILECARRSRQVNRRFVVESVLLAEDAAERLLLLAENGRLRGATHVLCLVDPNRPTHYQVVALKKTDGRMVLLRVFYKSILS